MLNNNTKKLHPFTSIIQFILLSVVVFYNNICRRSNIFNRRALFARIDNTKRTCATNRLSGVFKWYPTEYYYTQEQIM